jgi:hypothetical protein
MGIYSALGLTSHSCRLVAISHKSPTLLCAIPRDFCNGSLPSLCSFGIDHTETLLQAALLLLHSCLLWPLPRDVSLKSRSKAAANSAGFKILKIQHTCHNIYRWLSMYVNLYLCKKKKKEILAYMKLTERTNAKHLKYMMLSKRSL